MKSFHRIALPAGFALLATGCAMFTPPDSQRARQNEQRAQSAEARRAEEEREQAIFDRANAYQKQGLSMSEALSAARAEVPGPLKQP